MTFLPRRVILTRFREHFQKEPWGRRQSWTLFQIFLHLGHQSHTRLTIGLLWKHVASHARPRTLTAVTVSRPRGCLRPVAIPFPPWIWTNCGKMLVLKTAMIFHEHFQVIDLVPSKASLTPLKSKMCWQWEVYQVKNWMKITSQWIPTLRPGNIPAVLRNQCRKQITCQWLRGPLIFLHLECKFLLLHTWASGPAPKPLPEGQFLLQTVNHPPWIGISSQTEKPSQHL